MSCGMSVASDCANTLVLKNSKKMIEENAMRIKVAGGGRRRPQIYLEETKWVDVVAYQ